ncbi:MAG: DUF1211 domain-containing protein [Dehalococcoidia bacterium]|nr:DUF1211 domain-containing protein [Dehalococcoidia bacterium]
MRSPWEELEPATHALVERRHHAVRRVEQFADGVFAVALILMILHLSVPQLTQPPTEAALRRSLLEMWPTFFAYALSFVILFMYWVLHHFQFHYFTRASGGLIWLTGLMLAFVALLPFSTALVSDYAMTRTAMLFYEGDIFAIQFLLARSWTHATGSGLLFGSDIPPHVVQRMKLALRIGVFYVLFTMGLVFISPLLSMSMLAALCIYYVVLTARGGYTLDLMRRRPPESL